MACYFIDVLLVMLFCIILPCFSTEVGHLNCKYFYIYLYIIIFLFFSEKKICTFLLFSINVKVLGLRFSNTAGKASAFGVVY